VVKFYFLQLQSSASFLFITVWQLSTTFCSNQQKLVCTVICGSIRNPELFARTRTGRAGKQFCYVGQHWRQQFDQLCNRFLRNGGRF